jgi:hypothetical protein
MFRIMAGLAVGVLTTESVLEVNIHGWRLLIPLVALVAGLLTGLVAGVRMHGPGEALRQGALLGALVALLLVVADLASGAALARVTLALALASVALCLGVSAACAGIASAWTGYYDGATKRDRVKTPSNLATPRTAPPHATA